MIMMVSTVCCRAVACASIIQGSTGTAKILNNLGGVGVLFSLLGLGGIVAVAEGYTSDMFGCTYRLYLSILSPVPNAIRVDGLF